MPISLLIVISPNYCILLDQLDLKEWVHTIGWCWLSAEPTKSALDMPSWQSHLWIDFLLAHLARGPGKSYSQNNRIWILRLALYGKVSNDNALVISALNYPIVWMNALMTSSVSRLTCFLEAACSPLPVKTVKAVCPRLRIWMFRTLLEAVMYFDFFFQPNKWAFKLRSDTLYWFSPGRARATIRQVYR